MGKGECDKKQLMKDLRKAEKERDAQKAASIINLLVECEEVNKK